jgi:hypothetical protein
VGSADLAFSGPFTRPERNSIHSVREITPGVLHWTAFHEGIRSEVSSYFVEGSRTLIDPMTPAEGIGALVERGPERIVLSCRHHYRHSDRFVRELGIPVHCNEAGLHEFVGGPAVDGFRPGDAVAPDVVAIEVDALSPDETALRIDAGAGAVVIADGLVHRSTGEVGFVPDRYMGDDPEGVQRGLRAAFKRLLAEHSFDSLLFAHGDPIVGRGRNVLADFLRS